MQQKIVPQKYTQSFKKSMMSVEEVMYNIIIYRLLDFGVQSCHFLYKKKKEKEKELGIVCYFFGAYLTFIIQL